MKSFKISNAKVALKEAISTDNDEVKASQWINKDLAPTPVEARTWTWVSLSGYWWGNAFNTSQWSNGASLIAVGLTWWQALIACMMANVISSAVALTLGRPGATYHIGYPVLARSVFGMYGGYFFVALRAVVAIIWYSVQSLFGGYHLGVALRCIFGSSWWDMPNHLPESAGISSRDLLSFFLFWMLQLPFQFVHPTKIRFLFLVESVVCPIACFGLFGWCVNYGGGLGVNTLGAGTRVTGGALGWAMLNGINSCLGVTSALLVNQPDFTRYTQRVSDAGWRQAFSIFSSKTLIFFLGCGATAAVQGKFGEAYWNQWDLLNAILDRFWGPAARAGCFFAAAGFVLSVMGVNIGCNSVPFGADFTGLFPRYFTIVRGQILCAILSLVVIPWKLLTSAQGFLTFLGSYSIFMAPICALVICDYFFIKRGNIHTLSLFNATPGSLYYYTKGWNLRMVFCWLGAMVICLPGLIGAYDPSLVSKTAIHMYQSGWVITFAAAAVLSLGVNWWFPPRIMPEGAEAEASSFEAMTASEGYLPGETLLGLAVLEDENLEKGSGKDVVGVTMNGKEDV